MFDSGEEGLPVVRDGLPVWAGMGVYRDEFADLMVAMDEFFDPWDYGGGWRVRGNWKSAIADFPREPGGVREQGWRGR